MSRTIVVWIVLLGLAAAGAVWFFSNYERVTEKQWVGYSGEARHNPFLAAERLLARMGVAARHVKTIPELKELPVNGTLILPDRREALTPEARLALLLWVENGGHLIVEDENSSVPDPILDAFGVTRTPVKAPGKVVPLEARLPHAPAPMKVEMHSIQSIEAPQAKVRVVGKQATHLAHFDRGRGRVTVLNDLEFLRNRSIGRLDHAEFLWQIVRFQPQSGARRAVAEAQQFLAQRPCPQRARRARGHADLVIDRPGLRRGVQSHLVALEKMRGMGLQH